MFDNMTVKDLVALLLTMPQEAKLVTYKYGNWPDVVGASCERMGNEDDYVELNLNYYEP